MESLDGLLAPLATPLGSIVGAPRGLRPLTVIGAVALSGSFLDELYTSTGIAA